MVTKVRMRLLLALTWLARRWPRQRWLWVRLADWFVWVGEDACRID